MLQQLHIIDIPIKKRKYNAGVNNDYDNLKRLEEIFKEQTGRFQSEYMHYSENKNKYTYIFKYDINKKIKITNAMIDEIYDTYIFHSRQLQLIREYLEKIFI